MLNRLSLFIALGATACGGMETDSLRPGSPEQEPEGLGPVTAGFVKSIERFDNSPLLDGEGHNPVVAVGPDGRVHVAAINEQLGWPAFEDGFPFPGQNRTDISTAMALVADSKGNLHATWTRGRDVLYAELDPEDHRGGAVVVGQGQKPNFALGADGRMFISFISYEDFELGIPPLVMVAEGRNGEFSDPVVTQSEPEWAGDPGQATLSGASMAVDAQGDLHLVYGWTTRGRTVVEYVRTVDGVWSSNVRIADAAFSPCPDIALDSRGTAHIVYLLENNSRVMAARVRDGVVSEPYVVYGDAFNIYMAKIAIDSSDAIHLIVHSHYRDGKDRLHYVARPQSRGMKQVDIAFQDESQGLRLTPRAGGTVVGPNGKLYVPFVRRQMNRSYNGTFQLATGVEVTRK